MKDVLYGVALQRQGHARTFTTATELVVVIQHPPSTTSRPLQRLQEHACNLYDRLRDAGDSSLEVFQVRLWRMTGSVGRGKRNILGDGLHWLTGLATSEEVEEVRHQAADLVSTLGQQDVAIRGTVACIKADRQWLSDVSKRTNELSRTLVSYQGVLTNVSGTLDTVIHNQSILVMRSDLHNVFTFLENTQTDVKEYLDSPWHTAAI